MKFYRSLFSQIKEDLSDSGKIVILYGARQTGKTTLSNDILNEFDKEKIMRVNADQSKYIDILSSRDIRRLSLFTEGSDILFIDEAQRIPDIGINLKILHDNLPHLKLLVTGSSSFDLANKIKEPLTGRTSTNTLYPLSILELKRKYSSFEIENNVEEYMIYGMYPGILTLPSYEKKERYLRELASAYLYKDIFDLSDIRNTTKIRNLLKMLAFQVGSEVSYNELANSLGLSMETVKNYVNLFEKAFVIFRLSGFSRNLRKEISKRDKIYFWDTGIRNTIIDNLAPFSMRNDIGALWENFVLSERLKALAYKNQFIASYFWRTYTGAELDYVEERNGKLIGYEIKFKKVKQKAPKTWVEEYNGDFRCITSKNFLEFIT